MMDVADLDFDVVELTAWAPPATAPALREMPFNAKAWTPADDQQLREHFAADTDLGIIAFIVDRTPGAVRDRIYRLGLRRRSTLPWAGLEDEELAKRYGAEPAARIAQDLGRAVSAVYARAFLLGLSVPAPPPWDDWELAQLRAGVERGIGMAQLAQLIGRPFSGVVSKAHGLGLRQPDNLGHWTEAEHAFILERATEGLPYPLIARRMAEAGLPPRSVSGIEQQLHKLGYFRGWGRAWTAEEDDVLKQAYARGDSLTGVQQVLGRTVHSLKWRAEELKLTGTHPNKNGFRRGPDWTEEEFTRVKALYGTMPTRELAKIMGRELRAIYTVANRLGLKHLWMRAFSPDEDLAIRVAWRIGLGTKDLGVALERAQAVVHKRAKRLGLTFGKEGRPAGGSPHRCVKLQGPLKITTLLELATLDERQIPARIPPKKGPRARPNPLQEAA